MSGTRDALRERMRALFHYFAAFARQTTSKWLVVVGVVSLSGCLVPAEDAAAERARSELECGGPIRVEQRSDLSNVTYEVTGCGKRVRYVCRYEKSLHPTCLPEPTPNIEAATE